MRLRVRSRARISIGLLTVSGSLGALALSCEALVNLDYSFAEAGSGAAGATADLPVGDENAGAGGDGGSAQGGTGGDPGTGGSMQGSAGTQGSAGCSGAGSAGACAAPLVLQGTVFDPDTNAGVAGVTLVATGSVVPPNAPLSSASGAFEYSGAPPDTVLDLTLSRPATGGIAAFQRTLLRIDDPGALEARMLRLPSVAHDWLVGVATACGVIDANATATDIDTYFNQRSTLLVEVPGMPGITSDQIQVTMTRGAGTPWVNEHESQLDSAPRAHVCFLQRDGNRVVGGTGTATTALGQFVMFRVRNADGGAGGQAVVSVTGQASAGVNFATGGGETGVVRLGAGWEL